jgi:hypothetical protein
MDLTLPSVADVPDSLKTGFEGLEAKISSKYIEVVRQATVQIQVLRP